MVLAVALVPAWSQETTVTAITSPDSTASMLASGAPVIAVSVPVVASASPWAPDTGDTAWILISSALVLMMTIPGLALFYSGLVRTKNVLGTMMQSMAMVALVTLHWYVMGYSLAFHSGGLTGGLDWAFLRGVTAGEPNAFYAATIPHQLFMVYQLMFAIITPALITGAFAERMKFSSMVVFLLAWLTFIYCPLAHWVWGEGGFMNGLWNENAPIKAIDFAGGTVVHISSGYSALVCALVLGKRHGYPKEPMQPHNLTYSFIGAGLLWVGWFGFNAGSAVSSGTLAVSAFVATHFATAAAATSWSIAEWIHRGKPSALGAVSGAVAGLVAVTPASGFITPTSAILMGLASGVVCFGSVTIMKNKFGYDDSLDAFGVHGVGGTLGAILTGVFASSAVNPALKDGVGTMGHQVAAVIVTIVFAGAGTWILLRIVDKILGLRVSKQDEVEGLDLTQHGEVGYKF